MAPFRHIVILAILPIFLSASPASATSVIPVSLDQLTGKADTIVAGVVRDSHTYWDEGRIYTDITVETMEFLKHPTRERPETIVVRTLGGRMGDMRMEVHGVPRLAVDEEVVLFLMKQEEIYTIYGLHYGLCRIETDPQNDSQKVSGPLFRTRTTQNLNTKALSLNPLPPQGERLETFLQRIRELTKTTDNSRQP